MRALVFALVFANLLLFAWAQGYFGSPASTDAARLQQQLNTDKLFIVGRGETQSPDKAASAEPTAADVGAPTAGKEPAPEAAKAAEKPADGATGKAGDKVGDKPVEKPAEKQTVTAADKPAEKPSDKTTAKPGAASQKAAETKAPLRCLQWHDLAAADADRLERLVAERFAGASRARSVPPVVAASAGWWVFIPPLANRAEAERKASELKRLAVPEFFIVQEAGANRLAISLGIFSTEEAANERLNELREKGVRSARVGERNTSPRGATLEVRISDSDFEALRLAAAQTLPAARASACGGAR